MAKKEPANESLEPDRLLTAPEVMRLLHVSRSLIYVLINNNELLTVRVGHALRFRLSDVQDYIRRRAAPRRPGRRS